MLTGTMKNALDFVNEKQILYKYDGGFWAEQGLDHSFFNEPGRINHQYIGSGTVMALERRGLIKFIDYENRGHGEVPIRAVAV